MGGVVEGVVASLVFSFIIWLRNYFRRPILSVMRANLLFSEKGLLSFDIYIQNIGKTAYMEPTINIDNLNKKAVSIIGANVEWTPEGTKMIYNHHKPLNPGVSFRLQFKVINPNELPDRVGVNILHLNGVEFGHFIEMSDLKCATCNKKT